MQPANDDFDTCDRDKLNLGSGKTYLPTHWNVDVNSKFNPDLVTDMRALNCQKRVFTEVLMHDVLDHVTLQEARVLLRKVKGWMKPGGILSIHTPNLDHLANILSKSEDKLLRHEALKWMYGTDGMGTTDYDTNKIRWAYNKKTLTEMMSGVGFKILLTRVDCEGFGLGVIAQK